MMRGCVIHVTFLRITVEMFYKSRDLTRGLSQSILSGVKTILERLRSARFFINQTFPRFSPGKTGGFKVRENLIHRKWHP